MTSFINTPVGRPEIADSGRIRLGAANRAPIFAKPVADSGRIRLGAASRRLVAR